MLVTNTLAAHGGRPTLTVAGPHYRWPDVTPGLEEAVRAQLHRSLSDRDAAGVIGEFETAFARFVVTDTMSYVTTMSSALDRREPSTPWAELLRRQPASGHCRPRAMHHTMSPPAHGLVNRCGRLPTDRGTPRAGCEPPSQLWS